MYMSFLKFKENHLSTFCKIWSQRRTKRLKKTKKSFLQMCLKLILQPLRALENQFVKIVVSCCAISVALDIKYSEFHFYNNSPWLAKYCRVFLHIHLFEGTEKLQNLHTCLQERGWVGSQYWQTDKKSLKRGGPNISVRLAYFHPNRLLTGLSNRKRKYFEE